MRTDIHDHATRGVTGEAPAEREHLARQLYDLVAQPIAAALRELEAAAPAADHDPTGRAAALVDLRDALEVVCSLADNLRAGTARPDRRAGHPLSRREVEVLRLAAGALSNAQIAAELFITEGTVKRHLTNIYAKLGAVSRLDAVNKAKAGWLLEDHLGVGPVDAVGYS
jgi:ATP/maltotriose-dependent transcriptional regulator MalT